jgi:hypothetical protein
MERKVPPKCSPRHPPRGRYNGRILLIRRKKHNDVRVRAVGQFPMNRFIGEVQVDGLAQLAMTQLAMK